MSNDSLKRLFDLQRNFSNRFFDPSKLSQEEKEDRTKSFALALHNEISSLVGEINFKSHSDERKEIIRNCLLYEGIDVFRYLLAIMNLWEFTPEEFIDAFDDKESYIQSRYIDEKEKWAGQPVVIFDVDDVIAEFKLGFSNWLRDEKGIPVDSNSKEYYYLKEITEYGMSSEGLFEEFIEQRRIRELDVVPGVLESMADLKRSGFWIHLATARPEFNRACFYDTYSWLKMNDIPYHKLTFSTEKMIWLSKTDYFLQDKVVCAVEDSTKHAIEYIKHGINVVSPVKSYNWELHDRQGVETYVDSKNLSKIVKSLVEQKNQNS